ncbi:MAG: hypothetical protein LBS27_00890 [Bifidobacteriaceae bacterium]|nr:hypothetical protein [Bifidobacteriaceae bacterium]
MRSCLARLARHRKGADLGITMVAVLASFTILIVVVLGSLAYLSASTKSSRFEQDTDLALAAAQSGVNDLLSRLRENPDYLAEVAATKDLASGYCKNPAVGGKNAVAAEKDDFESICDWPESHAKFYKFDNSSAQSSQSFHYSVHNWVAIADSFDVVSTGRSNGVTRSVRAHIARDPAPGYLYLSDYELADPTDYTAYYPDAESSETCGEGYPSATTMAVLGYKWEVAGGSRPGRFYTNSDGFNRPCLEPSFESWDVLDGRVHSNDTIKSDGATFKSEFTTSDTRCVAVPSNPASWSTCVDGTANFNQMPAKRGKIVLPALPPKNDPNVVAELDARGCAYDGATRIIFNGDGTMTVWSKNTDNPSQPARCGTAAELDAGVTKPVPDGSLIYVRDLDPVVYPNLAKPIPAGSIGGPAGAELPLGSHSGLDVYNDPKFAPSANATYDIELAMERPQMYMNGGNVWVEGEVQGTVTIWADSTAIITGDLTTVDDDNDLIGVMATGSVEVYNPVLHKREAIAVPGTSNQFVWSAPTTPERWASWPKGDILIEAAIIAGSGSFRVQNWKYGGYLGTLKVYGSIAQNFRGVVAQESAGAATQPKNGYSKDYKYNPKLVEKQPLLFEPLGNGDWLITYQEKVDPTEFAKKAP